MKTHEDMAKAAHEAATYVNELEYKEWVSSGISNCDICGIALTSMAIYNRKMHWKTHFGSRNFFCDLCPGVYSRGDILRRHLKKAHNVAFDQAEATIRSPRNQKNSHKTFLCETCKKAFARDYNLEWHRKVSKSIPLLIRH